MQLRYNLNTAGYAVCVGETTNADGKNTAANITVKTFLLEMYRGIFWVIDKTDDSPLFVSRKVLCDASGVPLKYADFRREAWNYFPRRRVEIKNGAAIVYHNLVL